jgi:hypothetical protein
LNPDLLIVGSVADPHVQAVCGRLAPACAPLVIDHSAYLAKYDASIRFAAGRTVSLRIHPSDVTSFDNVRAVWWRRPLAFELSQTTDKEYRKFLQHQYEFFWTGFFSFLPDIASWYNDWQADFAADRNVVQLRVASELGMSVPDTLISSSSLEAVEFAGRYEQTIFKSFGGSKPHWRPTRLFSKLAIDELWTTHNFPVIFQEYIAGDYDYRVICIDNHVTAVEFDTGRSSYRYDVRVDSSMPCRIITLESCVVKFLKQMLERFGLRYGAFDFRRRHSGELVFLELNPAGQFLYLDRRAGTDVSSAMARALSCGPTG